MKHGVSELEQAVAAQPRSAALRADLAVAYAQVGRREEALAAWEACLRLDPPDELAQRAWTERRRLIRQGDAISPERLRLWTAEGLAEGPDANGLAFLTAQLGCPDPDTRLRAAEALGERGDPTAVPALVTALGDEIDAVRQAVIRALGQMRYSRAAVDALVEVLKNEAQTATAYQAAQALRRLGTPTALAAVESWERGGGSRTQG